MCMIAATVTKDFGLIGTDSAQYDTSRNEVSFEAQKLFSNGKYLMTFIGTPLYFAQMDKQKLFGDMQSISLYLQDYLKNVKPKVEEQMKSEIADKDEQKPHLCLFVMGVHNKKPTLVQFNSFFDFKPKYLFSENGPKFATIYYGDDEKKKDIFSESTRYMEAKTKKLEKKKILVTPGSLGEILTRGIYKKADMEMETFGKKYAGGVVTIAGVTNENRLFSLNGVAEA